MIVKGPNLTTEQLLAHLIELGHLPPQASNIEPGSQLQMDAVAKGLQEFADFHQVENPMRLIGRPRCGVPDIQRSTDRAGAGQCKWPMLDVTWAQRVTLSTLPPEKVEAAFIEAMSYWNAVCGIRLVRTQDFNSANIYSQNGRIDGSSGTLAYSYIPCGASSSARMRQVYDSQENWYHNFLVAVICHEVGHAIGLDHDSTGQLMAPYVNVNIIKPQSKDIAQAQSRYGKPQTIPTVPPPPPTVPPTTPGTPDTPVESKDVEVVIRGVSYILLKKVDHSGT